MSSRFTRGSSGRKRRLARGVVLSTRPKRRPSARPGTVTTEVTAGLTPIERNLGLQWVAATVLGWLVGFVVCEALKRLLASVLGTDGLVIGTAIGIAQWLVLRRQIAPTRWWVFASIIGFGVGKAVGEAVVHGFPTVIGAGLTGAVIGLSLGVAQWLVLRHYVSRAGWWVPATILAWGIGWSVISLVEDVADQSTPVVYVVGATGAAVAGIITALTLIRLRRPGPV